MPNAAFPAIPKRIASDLVRTNPDMADLVQEYVTGLTQRLERMRRAIESSDFDELRMAAHQLRGSAGGYGYPSLTQLGARLEQDSLKRDMDHCRAAFEELQGIVAQISVRG